MEAWVDYAEQALDFAEKAQERFQTGDLETKRQILACLGTSLILKGRVLTLDLKAPLELIGEVAPAVRALSNPLEPLKAYTGAGVYGDPVGQSEEWGG